MCTSSSHPRCERRVDHLSDGAAVAVVVPVVAGARVGIVVFLVDPLAAVVLVRVDVPVVVAAGVVHPFAVMPTSAVGVVV